MKKQENHDQLIRIKAGNLYFTFLKENLSSNPEKRIPKNYRILQFNSIIIPIKEAKNRVAIQIQ